MCKVSVIIPVYNTEKYLEQCLNSVINQTLQDIEIICINDCSTDNSLQILKNYAQKDNRIKIIDLKENKGVSYARNIGINKAEGEYIGFVDSDDIVDLNFYEKLYNLASRENLDIVKGNMIEIDYKGNRKSTNKNHLASLNPMYVVDEFSTLIYKRTFLEEHHILFPCGIPLGEDILFLNNVTLKVNKVAYVNDAYYNYFRRENSMNSVCLSDEKAYSGLKVFKTIMENINASSKSLEDKDAYMDATSNVFFNCMNMTFKVNPLIKKECIQTWMILYKQIQYKDLINTKLSAQAPKALEFLQRQDLDGLHQYILPYKSWLEFLFATLKHKLRRSGV